MPVWRGQFTYSRQVEFTPEIDCFAQDCPDSRQDQHRMPSVSEESGRRAKLRSRTTTLTCLLSSQSTWNLGMRATCSVYVWTAHRNVILYPVHNIRMQLQPPSCIEPLDRNIVRAKSYLPFVKDVMTNGGMIEPHRNLHRQLLSTTLVHPLSPIDSMFESRDFTTLHSPTALMRLRRAASPL